jgi:hypothetical protein
MKIKFLAILVLSIFTVTGCSTNKTGISYQEGVRARIEQTATIKAVEEAFAIVDFSMFANMRVVVEVDGLSQADLGFIKRYVENRVLYAGGKSVQKDKAQVSITLLNKVAGIDEVGTNYFILSTETVRGEFRSTMSVIDLNSGALIDTYDLYGTSMVKR